MGEVPERGKPIDLWISESVHSMGRLTAAALKMLDSARIWDRAGKTAKAKACWEEAIRFLLAAEEDGERISAAGLPGAQLLLADTFRRLGRFDEAQGCCHRGLSGRPTGAVRSLLEFELELIAGGDTEAHSVDEVI